MTLSTITSGVDTSRSSKINTNFNSFKILTVDTGATFNISGNASANASYSFTSAQLANADYLIIEVNGKFFCEGAGSSRGGTITLKYEATAPSAVVYVEDTVVSAMSSSSTNTAYATNFKYVRTLSAGEKASGVTVKITMTTALGGSGGTCTFTNRGIVFGVSG